jgi:hypothetical protein
MQNTMLEQMKNVDIRDVNVDELVDIRDVKIHPEQNKEERVRDFVRQIGNPYCYRVGKIAVKVSFSEGNMTLEDRLESLMMKL